MTRYSGTDWGLLLLRLGFAALLIGLHGWTRLLRAYNFVVHGQPWTFVDLVAYSAAEVTMRPPGGVAEVVQAELVSGGFFSTVGPRLIAGRGIVETDDQPGAAPVLVMTVSGPLGLHMSE